MTLNRLLPLKNSIQAYSWGSRDALGQLFGIVNPKGEPQAEIWMGAHPKSPSLVALEKGNYCPLNELVEQYGDQLLGSGVSEKFGKQLPYLFKVLSAAEPLSIQVHPNREQAELGFEKENQAGIPLTAAHRNYRDDNHKPELIYALTPFRAMNGFRPISEIVKLFRRVDNGTLNHWIDSLERETNEAGLKQFYGQLMQVSDELRKAIVSDALDAAEKYDHIALKTLTRLNEKYPFDIGVLSPLLLNVIELQPGEAMFLDAGTLHAYLEGTGLEVMASSDNVLRGGLTPKHVDVKELLSTIRFEALDPDAIKLVPVKSGKTICYPVPVNDFSFMTMIVDEAPVASSSEAIELLFCQTGSVSVKASDSELTLKPGDSCIAPAGLDYRLSGEGKVAIVSCD